MSIVIFAADVRSPTITGSAGNAQATINFVTNLGREEVTWRLYYGTTSGSYSGFFTYTSADFDFTETTVDGDIFHKQILVSGLTNGTTYYFAASSLDAYGEESPLSAEVGLTPQGESELGRGRIFRSTRFSRLSRV